MLRRGAALFVISALFAIGCTTQPGSGSVDKPLAMFQADSLFQVVQDSYRDGDYEATESAASAIIAGAPSYTHVDEVDLYAARASYAREDYGQAVKYAEAIDKMSPFREQGLLVAADAYRQIGKYYESADAYSQVLAAPVDNELSDQALAGLSDVAGYLTQPDLDKLVSDYPRSPLAGEMALALAKKEFVRGNYDGAYNLLTELLYQFPQHKNSPEARQLLQLAAARRDDPSVTVFVEPYTMGILLPQTGRASRFGRYFQQGATIAVEEFNQVSETPVTLVIADSKGDPVDAVAAVRRLAVEDGVVGMIGAVSSSATVAGAIESNAWKVPFLSPFVTEQRVDEIGPWVFETKIPQEVEVSAIAGVARDDLLLERFAILSPSTRDKRRLAEFFAQEVTSRGGEVVALEYYSEGDSDFKEQLDVVREARPDGLFIPGDPQELILLLPQVSFYDMQIQLLGLSNWNSDNLLRLSQRELEGALFPREAHYGRDRESFGNFASAYQATYGGEAHPVAASGYFGMRVLLQAVAAGVLDRGQLREYMDAELIANASERMLEAGTLPIVKVRRGKVTEFTAYADTRSSAQ